MAKVALLIGVSEYGSGLNPLPGAIKAVEAMQQVLQPLEMGGFDEVKRLFNPNPPVMRKAIETLFSCRTRNDLVLLFFSGHVVRDESGNLYFATSITCKSSRAELIKVSTVPVGFVHEILSNSDCQRQVVILDGCLSRLSASGMTANEDSTTDIKTQLGGKGRAILTCLTSTHNSFEPEGFDHSVYSRYLAEGIRTGAADLDNDAWISVDELHKYASNKVQIAAPALKPEFYPFKDGNNIVLAKASVDDRKLNYRRKVETWVRGGEISESGRPLLEKVAQNLQLSFEDCTVIEAEVLKPYQEYQEKLQRYERELSSASRMDYPLDTQKREELRVLQVSLGLRDEDVIPVEERIVLKLGNNSPFEDDTNEPAQRDSESQLNSEPSTPSPVLPEYLPTPTLAPTNPTATVDFSSSLANSQTNLPSVSTSSNPKIDAGTPGTHSRRRKDTERGKELFLLRYALRAWESNKLLLMGIGGGLAILAVAIGLFNRKSVTPPTAQVDSLSPSASPSPKSSSTATNSDKKSTPSAIASPESKVCTVFVNGNLRSEPTGFRNNVIETLREPLVVTGKQTQGGWVQVRLPSTRLAWAYEDIIANKTEMDSCLSKKEIPIKIIEDIPPPPESSFP